MACDIINLFPQFVKDLSSEKTLKCVFGAMQSLVPPALITLRILVTVL